MFKETRHRTSYVHNTPCNHRDSHRLYLFARHLGCTKKQGARTAIDALEHKHKVDGVIRSPRRDSREQGGRR